LNLIYSAHELIIQFPDFANIVIDFVEKNLHLGKEIKLAELSKDWLKLAYKKNSQEPTLGDMKDLVTKKINCISSKIRRLIGF